MQETVLKLPYPISANRYWAQRVVCIKGKWTPLTYVTHEAVAYKETVGWIAKAAGIRTPFEGRVGLHIELYPHRPLDWVKRTRDDPLTWDDDVKCIDLGNAEKVLADALEGIAYVNDMQIWHETKDRREPDGEARVILRIWALPPRPIPQLDLLPPPPPRARAKPAEPAPPPPPPPSNEAFFET